MFVDIAIHECGSNRQGGKVDVDPFDDASDYRCQFDPCLTVAKCSHQGTQKFVEV